MAVCRSRLTSNSWNLCPRGIGLLRRVFAKAAFTSASSRRRPTKLVGAAVSLPVAALLATGTM
jgi:hypothetical protein